MLLILCGAMLHCVRKLLLSTSRRLTVQNSLERLSSTWVRHSPVASLSVVSFVLIVPDVAGPLFPVASLLTYVSYVLLLVLVPLCWLAPFGPGPLLVRVLLAPLLGLLVGLMVAMLGFMGLEVGLLRLLMAGVLCLLGRTARAGTTIGLCTIGRGTVRRLMAGAEVLVVGVLVLLVPGVVLLLTVGMTARKLNRLGTLGPVGLVGLGVDVGGLDRTVGVGTVDGVGMGVGMLALLTMAKLMGRMAPTPLRWLFVTTMTKRAVHRRVIGGTSTTIGGIYVGRRNLAPSTVRKVPLVTEKSSNSMSLIYGQVSFWTRFPPNFYAV